VQACPLGFSGDAIIACAATGLTLALHFRPFKAGSIRGSVQAAVGQGEARA
jgi:hypothetical protein